jgi:hypothetical protein
VSAEHAPKPADAKPTSCVRDNVLIALALPQMLHEPE